MSNDDNRAIWDDAAAFDNTLRANEKQLGQLGRKRILPRPYTREEMFEAMASGKPAVLSGLQVPVKGAGQAELADTLARIISQSFKTAERISVQAGPSRARKKIAVPELMRRWRSGRHLVSVTDLHIRGTRLEREIQTDELSAFNILPLGSESMQSQEMMTLVISSRGNVTDSHSDDPDGSNHCFCGRKLWLAWETYEGLDAGLQDCERGPIFEQAKFDIATFCKLKSAWWWTVGPQETLFLPGKLTHKVVTLEPYIGIGSFYVAPATCLDSLSRWYVHGPLWSLKDKTGENAGLVDEIARTMAGKFSLLARQSANSRRRWGLEFAPQSLARWRRCWPRQHRDALMSHPPFAKLVDTIERLASI